MNRYTVLIARRAVKRIAGLPYKDQQRVRAAIDRLADEPRPRGCAALAGAESVYRVRVGNYRILYEITDARLVVQMIRVGHRSDVYQRR